MKITDVKLRRVSGTMPTEGGVLGGAPDPPDRYLSEHKDELMRVGKTEETTTDGYPIRAVFVQIETDAGITGLGGPIGTEIASIIDQQFRWLLIGGRSARQRAPVG